MKRKGLFLTVIAVLVVFIVSGLLSASREDFSEKTVETTESDETEDLIVVGFSQLGSESVWRSANTDSLEAALSKENGFFLQSKNGRQKQENQIKAIRSFISQRVDYIVLCPIEEDGWTTVLTEAKDAGIPVILMDRTVAASDSGLYTARVGTDFYWEGEQAGRWLEMDLIEKKEADEIVNIVVLNGTMGATSQIGRSGGFKRVAKLHKNWVILAEETADFTTAKGKEVMEQFIKKYGDIDVLVSQNDDMTMGAIEAIRESGRYVGPNDDIRIISFDAGKSALEMVQAGEIDVDIERNPLQGEAVAEVIRKLENDENINKEYMVEDKVFTMENVSQYLDDRTY